MLLPTTNKTTQLDGLALKHFYNYQNIDIDYCGSSHTLQTQRSSPLLASAFQHAADGHEQQTSHGSITVPGPRSSDGIRFDDSTHPEHQMHMATQTTSTHYGQGAVASSGTAIDTSVEQRIYLTNQAVYINPLYLNTASHNDVFPVPWTPINAARLPFAFPQDYCTRPLGPYMGAVTVDGPSYDFRKGAHGFSEGITSILDGSQSSISDSAIDPFLSSGPEIRPRWQPINATATQGLPPRDHATSSNGPSGHSAEQNAGSCVETGYYQLEANGAGHEIASFSFAQGPNNPINAPDLVLSSDTVDDVLSASGSPGLDSAPAFTTSQLPTAPTVTSSPKSVTPNSRKGQKHLSPARARVIGYHILRYLATRNLTGSCIVKKVELGIKADLPRDIFDHYQTQLAQHNVLGKTKSFNGIVGDKIRWMRSKGMLSTDKSSGKVLEKGFEVLNSLRPADYN